MLGMHLAYRWFTGLGFDQEIPHHSTFSNNRHGRFQESPILLELFEQIVQQCMNVGLLEGVDLSVDAGRVRKRYRRAGQTSDSSSSETEDKPELRRTYRNSPPMKISTTDPEAALSSKRGASEFAYYDNYLIGNRSCIIAGVMATPARLSKEIVAARQSLERAKQRFGLQSVSVTADMSYGTGEFLSWLSNRQITPYIPVLDRKQQTNGFYTQHEFTRVPEEDVYLCPGGHLLHYIGLSRGATALPRAQNHRNAEIAPISQRALALQLAVR